MKKLSLDKIIERTERDWPFVLFVIAITTYTIWKLNH